MRWLDVIADSVGMSLSKLWKTLKDRAAWCVAVQGAAESWARLSNNGAPRAAGTQACCDLPTGSPCWPGAAAGPLPAPSAGSFPDSWTRCVVSSMMEGTSFTFIQPVCPGPASHPSFPNCLWTQVPAADMEAPVHPHLHLLASSQSTVSLTP